MNGFVYLLHDAGANYSAAKMHAIPHCLLFLQLTFLDYFVPRSCASTMVLEHALSTLPLIALILSGCLTLISWTDVFTCTSVVQSQIKEILHLYLPSWTENSTV